MGKKSGAKKLRLLLIKTGRVLAGVVMCIVVLVVAQLCSNLAASFKPEPTATPAPTATPVPERENIIDLIDAGKVEVHPRGSGIDSLTLDIRSLVNELLEVEIPVGTYFISHVESTQNMVVRRPESVLLKELSRVEVELNVACANMHRSVPQSEAAFDIIREPDQAELSLLLAAMAEASPHGWEYDVYSVEQAAIWIVTDDATYADLGTLVRQGAIAGFPIRVIMEDDAARAMRSVDEAGIDITGKAIWQDRDRIIEGIEDDLSLIDWLRDLEQRAPLPG